MNPVAGWYTDPTEADAVRYWDGNAWTNHTAPAPSAQAVPTVPTGYAQPAAPQAQYSVGYAAQPQPTYFPNNSQPLYYPQPQYVVPVPAKNSKATRALVWGLISIVINPFALPSILAIVFGAQARRVADDMERAGLPNSRRGRATSAMVVGIVGAALFVVWMFFYLSRN